MNYIPKNKNNLDSFAVLCRGVSLELVKNFHEEFSYCYVINNFEKEFLELRGYLDDKKIIQFVNRSLRCLMSRKTYNDYQIKNIQFIQEFSLFNLKMLKNYITYKFVKPNLNISFLSSDMLEYNKYFPSQYKNKFPNTGILSILYAIDQIKPKNLWIFGLDNYSKPYLNDTQNPRPISLEQQKYKVDRLELIDFLHQKMINTRKTHFHICSYYDNWPDAKNVSLYR